MSLKIYLPTELFFAKEDCDIYGEIKISEQNAISYFIVSFAVTKEDRGNGDIGFDNLRHLGHIVRGGPASHLQQKDVSLCFAYDPEIPNIYLDKLSIKPPDTSQVNIFLYDASTVLQLHILVTNSKANPKDNDCDDLIMLYKLLNECKKYEMARNRTDRPPSYITIFKALNYPLELINKIFVFLMDSTPCRFIFKYSYLFAHHLDRKKVMDSGKRKSNITIDRLLGICFMITLLLFVPNFSDYLMHSSHYLIFKLRLLLNGLKGSPIGLKLNVQLNNFLLDCFNYHIDLWDKFLGILEPVVREIFVLIGLIGTVGFSYQLAILSDLISMVGLHAHCFYIYSAVLYKVEINGLQVLWKVVRGKRFNLLKNRVEVHNYINRQLYIATIFFATLLFLFPTIAVYYAVFTTVRLLIYFINKFVWHLRRLICDFPLGLLVKWLTYRFYEIESIHIQHVEHFPSPLFQHQTGQLKMAVFTLSIQSSSFCRIFSCESGVLEDLTCEKQNSLRNILGRILTGKF